MLLQVSGLLLAVAMVSANPVSYVAGSPQLQQLPHAQQALPQTQQFRLAPQPQGDPQAYQAQEPAYQGQPQPGGQQPQYVAPQQLAKLRPGGPPRGPFQPDPEDYDPNPQYQFSFDVKDDQFTNYQNRKESREGDKISGSYSVVDSDGFIRTVKYTADPLEGFKAEVTREPTSIVVKLPQPQLLAQPGQGQSAIQSAPSGPGGPDLTARQQATQQYLQAANIPRPQSQVFTSGSLVHPQTLPRLQNLQQQQHVAPQFALPPSGPQQYQAPSAKGASPQPGGANAYQAYQQ